MLELAKIPSISYGNFGFEIQQSALAGLNMGCVFPLFRAGAGLVLAVVIFVGFGLSLILGNFSDKLLSPDFYKDTIAAEHTYNRIYDEVLVDERLIDKTAELLGGIKVVSHQEVGDLIREIIPPAYIKGQIEGSIDRTVDYINEDLDYLDAYVDLTKPLENVKPVMFAYLDHKIEGLEVVDPGNIDCSVDGLADPKLSDLVDDYVIDFASIANGEVPVAVPSLGALSPLCRRLLFTGVYDQLLDSTDLPSEVSESFRDRRERLRGSFESGDTLNMLKIASRLLTESLIDEATAQVRRDLRDGDRFDLIRQLGEWYDSSSEAQIRNDISYGRDWISKARNFGDVATVPMVFGGAILMGLVFLPVLSSMLRWPGIALSITGLFFFVVGKIAESKVPGRLVDVVETGANKFSDVPLSVTNLSGDIFISFGSQLTSGLAGPSLSLLVLGAILIGASFLPVAIKRFIPFVN